MTGDLESRMSAAEAILEEHAREIQGLRAWRHETAPTIGVLNALVENIGELARRAAREAVELAFSERDKRDIAERERQERREDRGWGHKEWAVGAFFAIVMIGLEIWSQIS